MKKIFLLSILPLALSLTACQNVAPVITDLGTRTAPCVEGGPDNVAQQFYDMHISTPFFGLPSPEQLSQLRPYISEALYEYLIDNNASDPALHTGDLLISNPAGVTSAKVQSASTIPNYDAKNIPLRVKMTYNPDESQNNAWEDEVLMIREGICWVVDDIRYIGPTDPLRSGTLRQTLEKY